MLTNRAYILDDEVDFLHNYYERLVVQEVHDQSERVQQGDRDFLADVACVALNRLPPRYIRHDVDMTFFMSPQDMVEIERKVSQAVTDALSYVESRERGESPKLPPVEVSLISTRGDKPAKAGKAVTAEKTEGSKPGKAPAKAKTPKKK
ncbi:late competence development ComFB family protein [Cellvibrio sp. UBA7671]|uniref:late competence development ComFB family protein n=1 Tax=Cellvibrio sp. UBA7671 TaxID=1946312 RepID=UPI002F353DE4